jgi:hypothetical protein
MTNDIDDIIDLLKSYTFTNDSKKSNGEIGEQDAAAGGGGGAAKAMPKWSDLYVTKRGRANMLGKKGEVWSTGIGRGVANQIW